MIKVRSAALWSIVFAAGVGAMGATAEAGEINFTGNYAFLTGTGNGPILGVLSLQDGSEDHEWGYSGWSHPGGVGGALTGAGASPTHSWSSSGTQVHKTTVSSGFFAQSIGDITNNTGIDHTNLALVFQVNVAGANDTMTVRTFDVVFINADGSLAGTLTYTPDGHSLAGTTIAGLGAPTAQNTDNGVLPGVGQGSSGWLYTLDLSQVGGGFNAATFFSNANNRIGMYVPEFDAAGNENFNPVNDGSDNFWFTRADAPNFVPLPSAAVAGLGLLGLLGAAQIVRRRRQASA
jgi:hypothetical protein